MLSTRFTTPVSRHLAYLLKKKAEKKYLSNTDVLEIEDAQGLKREAPPTTDQSNVPKWSIIWREPTRRIQLRGIEAIFEYRPTSGDTGPLNPKFDLFLDPRLVLILLL